MDDQQILARAMTWMRRRNWREKLAKSQSGQSLYEHSLIELDVFLQLAPIFHDSKHYGLSDLEQNVLMVSLIVHDAGKETDLWQAYVSSLGSGSWVTHILPELSEKLVPEICNALGLSELSAQVHQVIAHCAGTHHDRPGQSDAVVIAAMLSGAADRFVTLANLVKAIDHLCSAGSPADAVFTAENDAGLQKHLKLATHELMPRGISTTLLHRAAQGAFERAGWKPLLYFATGTVYVADLNLVPALPVVEDIRAELKSEIETALKRDVTALMVGSPTGNILPKPDLLSFGETRQYLSLAGQKIGPQSFAKKKLKDRGKVVAEYLKLKGETETQNEAEIERQSGRISVAQPEMMVFKFFKAIVDPAKVQAVGEDGAAVAQREYEQLFGAGSWGELQSTSTLMAAKDMARTVDRFWELTGDAVGHPNAASVEQLPNEIRLDLLVDLLNKIASSVYKSIMRPSPREALAGAMADGFVGDLLSPNAGVDVKAFAASQMNHYRQSKPNAGKELRTGVYFCPICSKPFTKEAGKKASEDFLEKPGTHTNRGVSHGDFGYVMICFTCYYERILRQLLFGQKVAEIIAISPCLNLGPLNGPRLTQSVREWADSANGAKGLEFGFSLNFTDQAARHVRGHDPFELQSEELVGLFRYRYTSETQKKRKKAALDLLKVEFDNSLEALNDACPEPFASWDLALEALVAGKIDQQECKAIRRQSFGIGDAIELIPQTPNLILIPLKYKVASGEDESESSRALRRLYVTLILSVVFDASVSITSTTEIFDIGRSSGAAYVPPVPAVRSLIRKEWIRFPEARHWIDAIGAASVLARDAALPVRSALYQALTADPAEKLVRRIESKGRAISPLQLNLISQLPGFHSGRSQEVPS